MKRTLCIISCVLLLMSVFTCVVYAEESGYPADDFKTWLQGDPRWGNYVYGTSNTIRQSGCMITSISMLMAYANPELRDWNVFNPKICVRDYLYISGNSLAQWKVKEYEDNGKFKFVSAVQYSSLDSAKEDVRTHMQQGHYTVVYAYKEGIYSHFSPVVGWNAETDEPIVWDVGSGISSRNEVCEPGCCWNSGFRRAEGGTFTVVSWSSSTHSSTETIFEGNIDWDPSASDNAEELEEVGSVTLRGWEIDGMPSRSELVSDQIPIDLADRSNLSWSQQFNLAGLKENIESRRVGVIDVIHVVFAFVGLLLTVYAVFMFMAYLFDKVNSFLDISIVTLLSLGKLKLFDGDELTEEQRKQGYVTDRGLFIRIAVVFAAGVVFLSGLVSRLVYWIASLFS